jgi:Skp family chaperone for outer membrane proteins
MAGILAFPLQDPPQAQESPGKEYPSVAIINLQKVLKESAAARTIRPQMVNLKKTYDAKYKKTEADLRAVSQTLKSARSILSPEVYATRRQEFKNRVTAMQREVQSINRALDRGLAVAMGKIHSAVRKITRDLAGERSLKLILSQRGVMFLDPKLDLTSEVIKRLNEKLPRVKVEISSAKRPASKK